MSNFKQLNLAWQMYADDNDGALICTSLHVPNERFTHPQLPWVGGNLDYEPDNSENFNTLLLVHPKYAAFAPYIQNPSLYKCPSDKSTALWHGQRRNRVRSYQAADGWKFGSTYLPSSSAPRIAKLSWAAQPGRELTFIEGHADNISGGDFVPPWRIPGEEHVDFPSLAFFRNLPGSRHTGKCAVAFGDGRVELHKWRDPRTTPPERGVALKGAGALFDLCDPVNEDAQWIDSHMRMLGTRDAGHYGE